MFGGLKEKALAHLENDLRARVTEKIALFENLKPSDVQDNSKFSLLVIQPLWLAVKLQSAGTLGPVEKLLGVDLEARFRSGIFLIRDRLIRVEDDRVILDSNFKEKVGPTLIEAFQAKDAQSGSQ